MSFFFFFFKSIYHFLFFYFGKFFYFFFSPLLAPYAQNHMNSSTSHRELTILIYQIP